MIQDEFDLNSVIGKRLKAIRNSYALSLDEVAGITGVSKSMIGQIERGESTPTVTTLWKLCNGLNITLSTLLEDSEQDIIVKSKKNINPLKGEHNEFDYYPYFSFSPSNNKFDLTFIQVHPRKYRVTEPVKLATCEIIYMVKGSITIYENGREFALHQGDAMKIKSSIRFDYENKSDDTAEMISIQIY